MSSYDDAARAAETDQQRQEGEGAFLSQQEREQVRRILKFPEEFPREFGAWMTDYMAVNGLSIPISNIVGFDRYKEAVEDTQADLAVIGTTYSHEPGGTFNATTTFTFTTDPTVTVPAGTYFMINVATMSVNSGAMTCSIQLYNTGGAAVFGSQGTYFGDSGASNSGTVMSIGSITFVGESNQVQTRFVTNGSGNTAVTNRFLIALRTG